MEKCWSILSEFNGKKWQIKVKTKANKQKAKHVTLTVP
jgi:hypothetical protein